MRLKPWWLRVVLCCVVWVVSAQAMADGWSSYKSRFLTPDGRIIDTANNNVSHTEGQGYGMLLAVAYNDRATFQQLWTWTRTHLRNPQNDLFYWRYTPNVTNPVADKNDASDGDVLIAWALQRAAQKWQVSDYQQASDQIQKAIVKQTVIEFAGRTVMLPAAQGFNKTSYIVLNPSYFLFAAWEDFARHSHLQVWTRLIDDGMSLLDAMHFGNTALPLDWVALNADGSVAPALGYPPRFSYDAIRIPLNVWWYDPQSLRLVPFQQVWQRYGRLSTPAWFDVLANTSAPYNMDGGLLAIRDLTLNASDNLGDTLSANQNYFSASLQLLVYLARQAHASDS
ncbi:MULTISPECIES: glycosyl hydrolase family 8 [Pantoea]|uniref:cellulase n=1 Tax=Candidatus Pantoea multigeneris TaxID=2608357 RepID=A0ABX0RGW7_9GAMM|nr:MULTISPECIES: glycosyl hydrolase family 8 [Pantoea]NIF24577.1 endoglucanase [Pantoea multigeneris]